MDQEQSQVVDSLKHLHLKLDKVVQHLGISTGQKLMPSLISAHHGLTHQSTAQPQHDPQVDSLISQVEATLQHPTSKAPATTPIIAELSSRSESSSIGAAVRKQLDLVGEQLANKVCPRSHNLHTRLWMCITSCPASHTLSHTLACLAAGSL